MKSEYVCLSNCFLYCKCVSVQIISVYAFSCTCYYLYAIYIFIKLFKPSPLLLKICILYYFYFCSMLLSFNRNHVIREIKCLSLSLNRRLLYIWIETSTQSTVLCIPAHRRQHCQEQVQFYTVLATCRISNHGRTPY